MFKLMGRSWVIFGCLFYFLDWIGLSSSQQLVNNGDGDCHFLDRI